MTSFHPTTPGTSRSSADPAVRTQQLLVASMAGGLVMLGIALYAVGARLTTPPLWMVVAVGAASVISWALVLVLPVARAAAADVTARMINPVLILRAAVLEAPAILGFALAFVADPPSLLPYLVPLIFALAGLWLFARPSVVRARISRAS